MPARSKFKKGRANFYKKGTNNVICDRSGFKVKAIDCKMEWNGLFVRHELWEERHPQDFLTGIPDHQAASVSRPESEPVYLSANEVTEDDL